ncbi:MAG: efflux RND transporter permease subunit, partial [Candidatus Saccharicenans sp.]
KVIDQIRKENPEINLEIISEQAKYIQEAINTTKEEIIEGAILAFLTLLIFLQEWKSPLIIATVIPISIIGVFNLLFLKNITLNLMSLGGLALGVGMLDDTAVVVSESIFRHRQLGQPPRIAADLGTSEVIKAITASVLTTIVVFLPVIYVQGVAGQLFKDSALTVTFSLLSALLVSVTLLPMLASRSLSLPPSEKIIPGFNFLSFRKIQAQVGAKHFYLWPWSGFKFLAYNLLSLVLFVLAFLARVFYWFLTNFFSLLARPFQPVWKAVFCWFNRDYQKFLDQHYRSLVWSLNNKKKTFFVAFSSFIIIFALGLFLPRELIPPLKTSTYTINLKTPEEYSFEQTEQIVASLENWLRQQSETQRIFSQIGVVSGSESARPDVSVNSAEISVQVKQPYLLEKSLSKTRRFLAAIPELKYSVSREQTTLGEFLALASGEVSLKVKGQDLDRLRQIALSLTEKLKNIPGLTDINLNLQQGKPQLLIKIRKEALEKYPNLSPDEVASYLVQVIRGNIATKYRELEKKYDVRIRLETGSRQTIDQVLSSFFPFGTSLIPIHELITYELVKGPNEIRRENQEREIIITTNLRGKKLSQVVADIQGSIKELNLPADYRITFGGEREEMTTSFKSLFLAFIMALVLIYMIMAAQFESLLHPFLIMFTVPMGLVGTIILLLVTGQSLNAISIIGIIVLIGVVVDNAIVEIDYINQLRQQGLAIRAAVLEGSQVRLRPIMMSTMSTITGLIPMALGLGRGAELLRPLAIAVIGGLTSSLFLTLILIPVLYEFAETKIKRKIKPIQA